LSKNPLSYSDLFDGDMPNIEDEIPKLNPSYWHEEFLLNEA